MDTTKKYISMCEKAEEIQEKWKPKRGDFYTVVVHGKATDIINIYIDGFPCLPQGFIPLSELYIWLPRQDQLQEMIALKSKFHRVVDKLYDFREWVEVNATYVTSDCSLEQLWLAFGMFEKYKKTWDGEKWITKK